MATVVLAQPPMLPLHIEAATGLATSPLTEQDGSAWQQTGAAGVEAFSE